jgi:hypothetical protein
MDLSLQGVVTRIQNRLLEEFEEFRNPDSLQPRGKASDVRTLEEHTSWWRQKEFHDLVVRILNDIQEALHPEMRPEDSLFSIKAAGWIYGFLWNSIRHNIPDFEEKYGSNYKRDMWDLLTAFEKGVPVDEEGLPIDRDILYSDWYVDAKDEKRSWFNNIRPY